MSKLVNHIRNSRAAGAVPIQLPLLVLLYSLLFLFVVELVFLFWVQSTVNTAARQIATNAASIDAGAINPDDPTNAVSVLTDIVQARCREAAALTEPLGPGYSPAVKANFDAAVNGSQAKFFEYTNTDSEKIRDFLIGQGISRPGFFDLSASNADSGGCFGLYNPVTRQLTFYVVLTAPNAWPIITKFLNVSGTLQATGAAVVNEVSTDRQFAILAGLNRSLDVQSVRPFVLCTEDSCGDPATEQTDLLLNGGICKLPPAGAVLKGRGGAGLSAIRLGTAPGAFAIDQTPDLRTDVSGLNTLRSCAPTPSGTGCQSCPLIVEAGTSTETSDCNGTASSPSGITEIRNCGSIDPLILVGVKYGCRRIDRCGRQRAELSDEFADVTECGDFVRLVVGGVENPASRFNGRSDSRSSGQLTNLDGSNGPLIIRRQSGSEDENIRIECRATNPVPVRTGDGTVLPDQGRWNGPYTDVSLSAVQAEQRSATFETPLDRAIPYASHCPRCGAGSPRCGFFGTFDDALALDNPRTGGNLSSLVDTTISFIGQLYTNTAYTEVNPIYVKLDCKYRRDCKQRNCCTDGDVPGRLADFCSNQMGFYLRDVPTQIIETQKPPGFPGVDNNPLGWNPSGTVTNLPGLGTVTVRLLPNSNPSCGGSNAINFESSCCCAVLDGLVGTLDPANLPIRLGARDLSHCIENVPQRVDLLACPLTGDNRIGNNSRFCGQPCNDDTDCNSALRCIALRDELWQRRCRLAAVPLDPGCGGQGLP